MNSTSPSSSWVRMAARSPARSRAGPDVMCRWTPISAATMPASVVLPRPGRTGEQQVVGGLAAPAGRLEDDLEVLLELGLADELVEPPGPQRRPRPPTSLGHRARGRAAPRAPGHRSRSRRPAGEARAAPARSSVGGVAVVGQVGAWPRGSRRARSRARPARSRTSARADGPWPAAAAVGPAPATTGTTSASGTSRRDFSSTSSRAAVFLPTPGTRHRAATSSSARMRAQRRRARAPTGWRAPAPARRRGRRAAPRR